MPTLGGGSVSGRRRTMTGSVAKGLLHSNPSSVSTSAIETVAIPPDPAAEDKIYSKSMGALPNVTKMDPVVVDDSAKSLIRSAFNNLEHGDFKEALNNVNEILRIVGNVTSLFYKC
jgi:hypothetical protein